MFATNSFSASRLLLLVLALTALLPATGCVHQILATGIYLWDGGNLVPGKCDALEGQRVVVVCRPPASNQYSHAGASRDIAKRVGMLLARNVPDIDVVNHREVDNWIDESDWEDVRDLGDAVKADKVVHIELENFDLYKGKTLYQGNAYVTVTVYDMNDKGKPVWDEKVGDVLYPRHSGIPQQDKPVQHFQREFVEVVATEIGILFYSHDPHASFAIDALAHR